MAKTKKVHDGSRIALIRIAKIHVVVALAYAAQLIIYDAGKLFPPEIVLKRWFAVAGIAFVAILVWYLARINNSKVVTRNLAWFLIIAGIAFAAFNIYTQRGMASRGVILFLLPIFAAAALQRKGLIFLASAASVLAYIVSAIAYFVLNFNEGYKLELYGEIGFYSAFLMASGAIVWTLVRSKR